MLRLPKDLAEHPHLALLETYFAADARPLRDGSAVLASHWPFTPTLRAALSEAFRSGHLAQGLEAIATALDREKKGLDAAAAKTGSTPAPRLSRLLLLSRDGSERFYRDAEAVLVRHDERAWAVVLDVDADELGRSLTAKGHAAKALMIDDRKALGAFLGKLADSLAAPPPRSGGAP